MTANTHATLQKTKFFLNRPQSDVSIDDRLADFMKSGDEWFEGEIAKAAIVPYPVTTQTTMIASMYAAGLWLLANQQDKSKTPALIGMAIAEMSKMLEAPPSVQRKESVLVADDPRDKKMPLPCQSSIYSFDNYA